MDYKERRKAMYPSVEDQLDALWKFMDEYAALQVIESEVEGEDDIHNDFYRTIALVKNMHPKPGLVPVDLDPLITDEMIEENINPKGS